VPGSNAAADRTVAWLTLQDGGGDIVALVKTTPNTSGGGGGGRGGGFESFVAAQWTHDPYGGMLGSESLAAHPPLHAGHKGLFFNKLRGPLFASVSSGTLKAGGMQRGGCGSGPERDRRV